MDNRKHQIVEVNRFFCVQVITSAWYTVQQAMQRVMENLIESIFRDIAVNACFQSSDKGSFSCNVDGICTAVVVYICMPRTFHVK